MSLWLHQIFGVEQVIKHIAAKHQRICLTSPTGGGKTRMMVELIRYALERGWRVVIYTNRKLLVRNIRMDLDKWDIEHGVRAAGKAHDHSQLVQVSSVQTEQSRVYRKGWWPLHDAQLVIVDECHNQKGGTVQKILDDHEAAGAFIVGFTATPLGVGGLYKHLVVAGKNSELRACGAHVPCYTFAPDEPDARDLKPTKTGEYTADGVRKAIMTPNIFARVLEYYKRLNPDNQPAILFAPGVGESIWFAEQFQKAGIRSAHIDGTDIWLDGNSYRSSDAGREDIINGSKDGSIKVVCNRFVMREGVDMPWLYHGIFATMFGSLTSFLQAGGRLLRAHPSLDRVILQDHGGSWHRHGSLNADREWRLDNTPQKAAAEHEDNQREGKTPQPIVCPKCSAVRASGNKCGQCGHEHHRKSRIVIQRDGSLREMTGDVYKPRRVKVESDTERKWRDMYWRMARDTKRSGHTFRQAEGLFFHENGYYPPRDLPYMPRNPEDWHREIRDVRRDTLIQPKPKVETTPLFG